MKLTTLALLFVGAVSAAPAPQTDVPAFNPAPAALGTDWSDMTGCTCLGWPFALNQQIFFSQANGKQAGWCWDDGQMTQRDRDLIRTAVTQNRRTNAANGIQANVWCRARGIPHASSACVSRVIREFTRTQGPGLLSLCQYPAFGTFTPTTCDCGFTCNRGYSRCGRWCPLAGTQCAGGVPVEPLCEPGFWICNGNCIRLNQPCVPINPRAIDVLASVFEERDASDVDERDFGDELDERDFETEDLDSRSEPLGLDTRDADADPENWNKCHAGWVWCAHLNKCHWKHCPPNPPTKPPHPPTKPPHPPTKPPQPPTKPPHPPQPPVCKKGWYWCAHYKRCIWFMYKCPRDVSDLGLDARDADSDMTERNFEAEDLDNRSEHELELDPRDADADADTDLDARQAQTFDPADGEPDIDPSQWEDAQKAPEPTTDSSIASTGSKGGVRPPNDPVPLPTPWPICRWGWRWCPNWGRCFRGRVCPRRCRIGWRWCRNRCVPNWYWCRPQGGGAPPASPY